MIAAFGLAAGEAPGLASVGTDKIAGTAPLMSAFFLALIVPRAMRVAFAFAALVILFFVLGGTAIQRFAAMDASASALATNYALAIGYLGDVRQAVLSYRATLLRCAPHQRKIFALDGACLQLAHQIGLRGQRFGYHHQAAGILVQPVHDARTRHAGQLRTVMQQTVQQRAGPVAGQIRHAARCWCRARRRGHGRRGHGPTPTAIEIQNRAQE